MLAKFYNQDVEEVLDWDGDRLRAAEKMMKDFQERQRRNAKKK